MKYNIREVKEVRPVSKSLPPKVHKTFSISMGVWAALFDNVPEGKRSQYVEKAIIAQMCRDGFE